MVKTTQKSDLPLSAIFSVIVYYVFEKISYKMLSECKKMPFQLGVKDLFEPSKFLVLRVLKVQSVSYVQS